MRNGGAHDNGPGACINRGTGLLGRMHAALADDGKAGKLLGRLAQERQIGTVGHGAIDSGNTMRKRGGYQVETHINRTANVLDGGTIRHQEHTLLVQRAESILDRLAIGARTIGGVDRHDIGARSNAGASVTERRRDINAFVPILPQADNRNLTATLNGGNVGKALAANGGASRRAAMLCRIRNSANATLGRILDNPYPQSGQQLNLLNR